LFLQTEARIVVIDVLNPEHTASWLNNGICCSKGFTSSKCLSSLHVFAPWPL